MFRSLGGERPVYGRNVVIVQVICPMTCIVCRNMGLLEGRSISS